MIKFKVFFTENYIYKMNKFANYTIKASYRIADSELNIPVL